jgi:hypothetical protein
MKQILRGSAFLLCILVVNWQRALGYIRFGRIRFCSSKLLPAAFQKARASAPSQSYSCRQYNTLPWEHFRGVRRSPSAVSTPIAIPIPEPHRKATEFCPEAARWRWNQRKTQIISDSFAARYPRFNSVCFDGEGGPAQFCSKATGLNVTTVRNTAVGRVHVVTETLRGSRTRECKRNAPGSNEQWFNGLSLVGRFPGWGRGRDLDFMAQMESLLILLQWTDIENPRPDRVHFIGSKSHLSPTAAMLLSNLMESGNVAADVFKPKIKFGKKFVCYDNVVEVSHDADWYSIRQSGLIPLYSGRQFVPTISGAEKIRSFGRSACHLEPAAIAASPPRRVQIILRDEKDGEHKRPLMFDGAKTIFAKYVDDVKIGILKRGMPACKQLAMYDADVVVTVHGSHSVNRAFMRRESHFIEIDPYMYEQDGNYVACGSFYRHVLIGAASSADPCRHPAVGDGAAGFPCRLAARTRGVTIPLGELELLVSRIFSGNVSVPCGGFLCDAKRCSYV